MPFSSLQAVVLAAGTGTRYPELTSGIPKCLMPVGPFPMIWYPLHTLQKSGFQGATVVVLETQKAEIQQALEKTPLTMKLDFATIPADSDFGTAESLVHIQHRIDRDIVVISCDSITSFDLEPLVAMFDQNDATLATLFFDAEEQPAVQIPGPKSTKHVNERELVGVHLATNRLLFAGYFSDYEESFDVSGRLLRRFGRLCMYTRILDSHIYVMKRWVVDFLANSRHFGTIKNELLPYLVKKQLSKPKAPPESERATSEYNVNVRLDDIFHYACDGDVLKILKEKTNKSTPHSSDIIKVYAQIVPKESFGLRVNTMTNYCLANRSVLANWTDIMGAGAPPLISSSCDNKCTQLNLCAVADNSVLEEKTSLKSCTIGANCTISSKTRITESIIMKGATIEEGVVLENCIVCENAIVRQGSELKGCIVGRFYVVQDQTKAEKALLAHSEACIEI
ncbi:translation initiation factor eIF-2B subunit gamma [Phlebotomus argentipes]|uniref:translation initiation factor eIF-2B subunit gamma n=1 Tax=Phlebotomus argentipes TaxID=94469 RepID=UPI00289376E9|nr:translation initiation factor eIF-2B subunit gamma [Phlebotomus argentipes]